MARTLGKIAGFALAASMVAACGGGDDGGSAEPAPPAESAEVVLEAVKYQPQTVTVFTGGTVTWVWKDGNVVHDVKGGDFKSDLEREPHTFEHTFDEAGTFEYVCSVHPAMKGEVTVVDR